MHTETHTSAQLEVSMLIFNRIRDQLEKAGYEYAFTRVGGEVVLIDMQGIALVQESPKATNDRLQRTVKLLMERLDGDHYERAEQMTNEVLLEALCGITAKKGETKMEDAVVTTVCDRLHHPFTWWIVRAWKKLRGKL